MFTRLTAAAVAVAFSSAAHAVVVDFEVGNDCTSAFAAITAGAGAEACRYSGGGMNMSRSLVRSSARGDTFWTAVFTGTASAISVQMGDKTADDDRLFLRAFDGSDNLLEETLFDSLGMNRINHTLSLAATGVAYVTFGITGDLGAGSGIFADNLTFTLDAPDNITPSPVPLPAAGLLLMGALAGAAALRRKS